MENLPNPQHTKREQLEVVKPDAVINPDGTTAWEKPEPIFIRDFEYDGKKTWAFDFMEAENRVGQWLREKFSRTLGSLSLRKHP
jgi:hypothetical protein